jgi:hypothetical protein
MFIDIRVDITLPMGKTGTFEHRLRICFVQLVNIFISVSGKLSSLDDLGDIPFPVTYYTLSEKDLEDNGYSFNLPGYLLSFCSKM